MRFAAFALFIGCASVAREDPPSPDAAAVDAPADGPMCPPMKGPVCCHTGQPQTEAACVGPNAWQCPLGFIAKNREEGCGCASSATSAACVQCCRQPDAPNYGGFELYASSVCAKCPECMGMSPCGTNVTPPADAKCVTCLQEVLTMSPPTACLSNEKCADFAKCLSGCPRY